VRLNLRPVIAMLLGAAVPMAVSARQSPPPTGLQPSARPVRVEKDAGAATWFTIVAAGDSLTFAMPAKPTVQSAQELDGGISYIYECSTDRVVLQVYSVALPDLAVKKRSTIDAELYARLGFETILLGLRGFFPDASATFLGEVSQDGMAGGDGVIVASGLPVPLHLRVLRGGDGRMIIASAIARVPEADDEQLGWFMDSVRRSSGAEARAQLIPGTRDFLDVGHSEAVAAEVTVAPATWERVAPAGAGFSVLMPPAMDDATAKQLFETTPTKVAGRKYVATDGQVVLMIFVAPNATRRQHPPRSVLDSALRGFVASLRTMAKPGVPQFERDVTRNGVRGAAGRVTIVDGGYARFMTFETRAELYVLSAVVLYPQPGDDASVDRFFDSFEFVR